MKKLKVGINARILDTKQLRGWSRYTVELVRGLLRRDVDVVLLTDKPVNTDLLGEGDVPVAIEKGFNYFDWEQRVLPSLAQKHKVDILHCPINYGLPLFGKTKKILTLHDAIEKAFYDSKKSFIQRWHPRDKKIRIYHRLSQMAADRIITVSEHAKQDIINFYGVPEKKITVIYEAADDSFNKKNVKSVADIQRKYPQFVVDTLFYVGGLEDRKNIENLLKAYSRSKKEKKLMIAGGSEDQRQQFKALAIELNIKNELILMAYIADEDLPSFYHYCHSFIYPSLYEGFGLQAVEAMKMQKAVIASSTTSLKEIVGFPEGLFDPNNVIDISKKINWIFNEQNALKLSQYGSQRAQQFSWDRCLDQTLEVYREVLIGK